MKIKTSVVFDKRISDLRFENLLVVVSKGSFQKVSAKNIWNFPYVIKMS